MEFWGVEVKPKKRVTVTVEAFKHLRITQAALGDAKTENEVEDVRVYLKTKNEGKYFVISSKLASEVKTEVEFEEDVVIYHGWEHGSVHICGYFYLDHSVTPYELDFGTGYDEESNSTDNDSVEEEEEEKDKYKELAVKFDELSREKIELEKRLNLMIEKYEKDGSGTSKQF